MQRRAVFIVLLAGLLLGHSNSIAGTSQEEEQNRTGLARAVIGAKASLAQGLATVTRKAKPLSARFEIEDGRLQISVYRVKDGQFSEVILDPDTAAIDEVDPITSGNDYTVAQNRSAALTNAKRSLSEAVGGALHGYPGFHAVSVVPTLKNGHPVAEIAVTNGNVWKTVTEKLD